jgi:hypothetical protein
MSGWLGLIVGCTKILIIGDKLTMENEYAAQYHDRHFKRHQVSSSTLSSLKRKLSKLDVVASAAIWKPNDKDFAIIYYKPRWWRK